MALFNLPKIKKPPQAQPKAKAKARAIYAKRSEANDSKYQEANRLFLASLATGDSLTMAANRAGKSLGCFTSRRQRDPEFASKWAQALEFGATFEEATKQKFLSLVTQGLALNKAIRLVGRSQFYLSQLRAKDPAFDAALRNAKTTGLENRLANLKNIDTALFFEIIKAGHTVEWACQAIAVPLYLMYFYKKHAPEFAKEWAEAMEAKKNPKNPDETAENDRSEPDPNLQP
ncbi:MAG: hypothetical protein LBT38_12585 [Deltaproteobacteria bacterium]|nr:hypothetical protein [Deltaproteobacteria bacterium]